MFVYSNISWSDRSQNLSDKQNYNHILALGRAIDGRTKDVRRDFYRYASIEKYIIDGDIIKAQYMVKPDILSSFNGVYEVWFRIINRNTIAYIQAFIIDLKDLERDKLIEKISKEKDKEKLCGSEIRYYAVELGIFIRFEI